MFSVPLDAALNLLWIAVGLVALALLALQERKRRGPRQGRLRRVITILVVTVALFPSVSSSDDLFSFGLINTHLGKHGGFGSNVPEDSKEKAGMQLFRLLETLSHFQVSSGYVLVLALCCVAFVLTLGRPVVTRAVLCRSGRAPPFA